MAETIEGKTIQKEIILEVDDLKKTFYKGKNSFQAVNGVSFQVRKGECLGIVGESGCGKSTIARMIANLLPVTSGQIRLNGKNITNLKNRRELKQVYKELQMVFQTPQDSFDPRLKLGDGIMESMINHGVSGKEAKKRMYKLLETVKLEPEMADRYPHQVSGGQCQRAAIARAIAINPSLVICDEVTSALDVTVQAQVIDLLQLLQKEMQMSYLFICHDLALVQNMCDRVAVMYAGRIVEQGTPDEVIMHPKEDYTRKLINSVF